MLAKDVQFNVEGSYGFFREIQSISADSPFVGRMLGAAGAILDVGIDMFTMPVISLKSIALAVINPLGVLLYAVTGSFEFEEYTLKHSMQSMDHALGSALRIPISIAMVAPKLIYQLASALIDPETIQPIAVLEENEEKMIPVPRFGEDQKALYQQLNTFSSTHPVLGRVVGVGAALIDIGIELVRKLAHIVELAAFSVINLVGALIYALTKAKGFENYTVKASLICLERALGGVLGLPAALVMIAPKLIYQIGAALIDPVNVQSISLLVEKFNGSKEENALSFSDDQRTKDSQGWENY